MSTFHTALIAHLASTLNVDGSLIESAFNSFVPTPSIASAVKTAAKKAATSDSSQKGAVAETASKKAKGTGDAGTSAKEGKKGNKSTTEKSTPKVAVDETPAKKVSDDGSKKSGGKKVEADAVTKGDGGKKKKTSVAAVVENPPPAKTTPVVTTEAAPAKGKGKKSGVTVSEEAPAAKSDGKKGKSKVSTSETPKAKTENHTCGYTSNGKGGPSTCGKGAAVGNNIDGVWYCGTSESGHYCNALAKKVSATVRSTTSTPASAKIEKKEKLMLQKIDDHWIDLESRIAFNKVSGKAYGVYGKDKILRPLNATDITLVTGGFNRETEPFPKKGGATGGDEESDSDDDDSGDEDDASSSDDSSSDDEDDGDDDDDSGSDGDSGSDDSGSDESDDD